MRRSQSCAILFRAAFESFGGAEAQRTPASEIAPTGSLRVGFQVGSPILAKRAPDGGVSGVVVDLGKFIAEKLGVAFEPIVYANQEAYAQSFGKGEWNIVIGVRSSLAEENSDLSPDFMMADAMYIAAPGREFADATQIDRPGVKVGVSKGGGSDQVLSRTLESAQVVRVPGGVPNAIEVLRTGASWMQGPRIPSLSRRLKMLCRVPRSSPGHGRRVVTRCRFQEDDLRRRRTSSRRSSMKRSEQVSCKGPSNEQASRAFALPRSDTPLYRCITRSEYRKNSLRACMSDRFGRGLCAERKF